jgi:hypothetical protein
MKRKVFLEDKHGEIPAELDLNDIMAMVKTEVMKEASKLIGQPNTEENRARLQESISKAVKAIADDEEVASNEIARRLLEAFRRASENPSTPPPNFPQSPSLNPYHQDEYIYQTTITDHTTFTGGTWPAINTTAAHSVTTSITDNSISASIRGVFDRLAEEETEEDHDGETN